MAHVVATPNLRAALARLAAREGLSPLMMSELRFRARAHTTCAGTPQSLARARSDQLALELGEPTQHRHHQPTVGRRRVGPGVGERTEARATGRHFFQHLEEIARRACQPIKTGDYENIARTKPADRSLETRAIAAGTARRLPHDLGAASGRKLFGLTGKALVVR